MIGGQNADIEAEDMGDKVTSQQLCLFMSIRQRTNSKCYDGRGDTGRSHRRRNTAD